MIKPGDTWNSGDPYEYFMGRWSRLMAPVFLQWLNCPSNLSWLDIGCGTGALSEAIYSQCQPKQLSCIDPSPEFLEKAKAGMSGEADFSVGNASDIPRPSRTYDAVVSGLAMNFFPDLTTALSEMKRVLKANGTIAAYVWDYAGGMDLLRNFWDAAADLSPDAQKLDEGVRFPICNGVSLAEAFERAGLADISATHLDINTVFKNFDDYWNPFLGGQGPAPAYVAALAEKDREILKNTIHERMPVQPDGSIRLLARAIAVRGIFQP